MSQAPTALAVLLLGAALMVAGADAGAEVPVVQPDVPASIDWAYDPFAGGLFGAADNRPSGFASVNADAIGGSGHRDTSGRLHANSQAERAIADDTRFGAGDLNELWGQRPARENLAATAPMFDGAPEQQPVPVTASGDPGSGRYAAPNRMTSRVSEFDGDAGALFNMYMRPAPDAGAAEKHDVVAPTLSRAKSEQVIEEQAAPNMPQRAATLTSRTTRIERLDIKPGMLRGVH